MITNILCYRRISLWVFSTTLSILHYKHSPAHALQMEKRKPFVRFDRSLLSFQKELFATPNKEHSDLISVPSLNMWTLYTLLVCLCVCVLAICSQIDIKMKLLWKLFHYFPFIECHVILSSIIILFNFIFFWAYFRSRVCLLNNSLHLTLFTLWCQAIAKKNATKNRIFDRNAMVLV